MNEAYKFDVYDQKTQITLNSFTFMDEDGQAQVRESLTLPDDILSDIIGDEQPDDINKLKEAINDVN